MRYAYYPGCSLEGACVPYDRSLRHVMAALGHELVELEDWNCCGATMYMSVKETVALSVSARNLALAERDGANLVAPCSACYMTLLKTQRYLREVPPLREQVDGALAEAGLTYRDSVKVRHPLDIIVNDIGVDALVRKARRRLDGVKVAPYYGCQIVRPEPAFDDPEWPTGMDDLFTSLGAECVYYPHRVRCCGGMLTTTYPDVGDKLTDDLIECARSNGANVVVTTCPLCHMNLESYQVNRRRGNGDATLPILFFTQLLGIALGAGAEEMDLHRGLVPLGETLSAVAEVRS